MNLTKADILLSSVNRATGDRITTFHLTFPRIVNSELLRHRLFCLSGDVELAFHLPSGQGSNNTVRTYRMTLKDFHDKWHNGAKPIKYSRKADYVDYSVLEDEKLYSTTEVHQLAGYKGKKATNLNDACRKGKILNCFKKKEVWYANGSDFKKYRSLMTEEIRLPQKSRLRNMSIRQIDENTNKVQTSHVKNVWFSGVKDIYRLKTSTGFLDCTLDHRVFTMDGWKRLGDLDIQKDRIAKVSKKRNGNNKSIQNSKIDGKWTAKFNRDVKPLLREEQDNKCKICNCPDIHHVIPVHQRPDLAFEKENLILICNPCHLKEHSVQGWQKGAALSTSFEEIISIEFLKTDETYDLEIDGEFHNFTANNFVVHNSVNSASSRAIPNSRLYQMIEDRPFIPDEWTKNQKGMYGTKFLNENDSQKADEVWYDAMRYCLNASEKLSDLGVHKQYVNRLLEPFQYIDLILTATCFENFFKLRIAKDAQPEIRELAELMKEALDNNEPDVLEPGEWHIPYLLPEDDELSIEDKILISSARCARVSYRTFDGIVSDVQSDKALAEKLLTSGHLSPFEHIAKCLIGKYMVGNLIGFCSYRKTMENEDNGDVNPKFIFTNEELKIFFGKNK